MRRKHSSERDQLELFSVSLGDLTLRDAQDLAKTRRVVLIDFRTGAICIRIEAVRQIVERQSSPGYQLVLARDPNGRRAAELRARRSIRSAQENRKRPYTQSASLCCQRQRGCAVTIALQPGDLKVSQVRSVS